MKPFNPHRLTEARQFRGLTTFDLAKRLTERNLRVSEVDVRSWEQGAQEPSSELQLYLAWVLDFPVERWSMPGTDEDMQVAWTTLTLHMPHFEQDKCAECDRAGEFLCDQRGDLGQFVCSVPLCVLHARAADAGGDYCRAHIALHDPAYKGA